MYREHKPLMTLTLSLALAASACSGDETGGATDGSTGSTGTETTGTGTTTGATSDGSTSEASTGAADARLEWTFSGLPDLGPDYVYEGWLIVGGEAVAAGRFSVDEQGVPSPDSFMVPADVAQGATTYVLTIEPSVGDDPAPSSTHILAGDFDADGSASLSVAHPAALGTDFAGAAGTYVLNTPSSAGDDTDYAQGIWWLDAGGADLAPGLTLPALPDGWVYEGWVVGPDGPVSTGTFTALDAADADGAGPDAGPDPAPPFPGQDFVDPPRVLTDGYAAVISVEPMPDNDPAPFSIKPLVDGTIDDVMPPDGQSMENVAADSLPGGTVTLTVP